MYIELETDDMLAICNILSTKDGSDSIYMYIKGIEFQISFVIYKKGYYEDDYENGTGAWVTTDANVSIRDISACDIDMQVSYDKKFIEQTTEQLLTL